MTWIHLMYKIFQCIKRGLTCWHLIIIMDSHTRHRLLFRAHLLGKKGQSLYRDSVVIIVRGISKQLAIIRLWEWPNGGSCDQGALYEAQRRPKCLEGLHKALVLQGISQSPFVSRCFTKPECFKVFAKPQCIEGLGKTPWDVWPHTCTCWFNYFPTDVQVHLKALVLLGHKSLWEWPKRVTHITRELCLRPKQRLS